MRERSRVAMAQLQMAIAALLLAALTVGSLAYVVVAKPAYLRHTRRGVAFYSPQVLDPVTRKPLDLNALAEYYVQGKSKRSKAP